MADVSFFYRCSECALERDDSVVIVNDLLLCPLCVRDPGWFRVPWKRERITPPHSGEEPALSTVPEWHPDPSSMMEF